MSVTPADVDCSDINIAMPDGCMLSAKIWIPKCAFIEPVPAILEHLPYRKRDGTVFRDSINHSWFAKNGYACVRTDIRGTGDSEGLLFDEYSEQELKDAISVIDWISSQSWCSGNVGMMGISWGGFNSLQVASRKPKQLKAVITLCSSVDRYADDIHYKGGCLLGKNFSWAANMISYSSRPLDPIVAGKNWRSRWLERLENLPLFIDKWLTEQSRAAYWKHGSICEEYKSVEAAVLSIGGWHDGYRNTVAKLVKNLDAPVKGVIGPWNHRYPHLAEPGPKIGFLQEALNWWDKWLKGVDNGSELLPDFRLYLMDSISPARSFSERPGRWISEDLKEESSNFDDVKFWLGNGSLVEVEDSIEVIEISSPEICGLSSGEFFPFNFGPELPDNQLRDDEMSVCFDSSVFFETLELVGGPLVKLTLMTNKPLSQVAVRLCDLRPDGTSALISHGFLNLTMRKSFEFPEALVAGKKYDVLIELDQTAYSLPAGHRLRLAVSNCYWPFIWPSPEKNELKLFSGSIDFKVRNKKSKFKEYEFEQVETGESWNSEIKRAPELTRQDLFDELTGANVIVIKNDFGCILDLDHFLQVDSSSEERWCIKNGDQLSATADFSWEQKFSRLDWNVSTEVKVSVSCDKSNFYIRGSITASENLESIFSRTFESDIERKFV